MTDEEDRQTTVKLEVVRAEQAEVPPSGPHNRRLPPEQFEQTDLAAFWWAGIANGRSSTPAVDSHSGRIASAPRRSVRFLKVVK
jgi:hypothetical protein